MQSHKDSDGARPGRERSFLALLVLSLITLTAYFYYWLYINLKELGEGVLQEGDKTLHNARTWYWIKIVLLLLVGSLSAFLTVPGAIRNPHLIEFSPLLIVFSIVVFTANVSFFYYFVVSVSNAQKKIRVIPLNITITFSIYLASLLIDLLSEIYVLKSGFVSSTVSMVTSIRIPDFSFLSPLGSIGFSGVVKNILWLICIYQVQSAINRIWCAGTSTGYLAQSD